MEFSEADEDEICTRLFGVPSDWNYADDPPKLLFQYDPLDNEMDFLDTLDGTSNKNTFQIGNKTYNKGILLKTNIHMELDMAGVAGATVLGTMLSDWGLCVLALAGAGEAHESAFAMANIKDSGYTSVTFTVAMQKDNSSMITQDETPLMIGADKECVWETTLYKGMEPTTFTVEFGECDRLMFWLNCGEEDMGSHTYAIYNITLNK